MTVLIKEHPECTRQLTYEASVGDLPPAFVDGYPVHGVQGAVRIRERSTGRHVEIHIRHIATNISIRDTGEALHVAVKMPASIAQKGTLGDSLQLCSKGCPASETISQVPPPPESAAMSEQSALSQCNQFQLKGPFLNACMFDLLNTGRPSFSLAAKYAQDDMSTHSPHAESLIKTWSNKWVRPTPPVTGGVETPNAPGRPPSLLLVTLLLIYMCLCR